MLLNSVIFILREVLEASILISILLAITHLLSLSKSWATISVLSGLIAASGYAFVVSEVSMAFDGAGQEIVNANLHFLIYLFVLLLIVTLGLRQSLPRIIQLIMTAVVTIAVMLEGFEVIIYITGFASAEELLFRVIIGSLIGTGIGISIGILFYYLIISMKTARGMLIGLLMLSFTAAGMVSQAIQFLSQADIIAGQAPLWNSNILINEQSLIGQLLYAVMSYEATPTKIQVISYLTSLVLILYTVIIVYKRYLKDELR
mgnify:CR=1 FL=1